MDEKKRSSLNDQQMLFTMLTALVKANQGEIRITEDQMDSVTKSDMMMMYYDKNKKEIILSLHLIKSLNEGHFH